MCSSFCINKYIMKKEMSKLWINKWWYAKKYFKMAIMLLLEIFRRLLALFCCDPACTQKLFNHIFINHDLYWIKLYSIRIKNLFSIASYLCIYSKELDVVSHSMGNMLLTPSFSRVVVCVLYTGKTTGL